jgi:hypothetical protein
MKNMFIGFPEMDWNLLKGKRKDRENDFEKQFPFRGIIKNRTSAGSPV